MLDATVEHSDVIVVGAGPIGIEVAAALRREGLSVIQFEAGRIGATMEWWAPGTQFFSGPERIAICGVPLVTANQGKATREEYLAYLRQVVGAMRLEIRTGRRVVEIKKDGAGARDGDGFGVMVDGPRGVERYGARKVVVAMGDMHRPRRLGPDGVPGEDLPQVSHYFEDPHRYFGRKVLIVGGRNSAAEAAIRLYRVGATVAMSYRREWFDEGRIKYWLMPELKSLIKSGAIGWYPSTCVMEIGRERVTLCGAGANGEPEGAACAQVEADDVLLLIGYEMDGTLLAKAGVELLERGRPRFDAETMETNVPGLFVAGTATAGTQQRFTVFIENCHEHGERIAAAIAGRAVREREGVVGAAELPES